MALPRLGAPEMANKTQSNQKLRSISNGTNDNYNFELAMVGIILILYSIYHYFLILKKAIKNWSYFSVGYKSYAHTDSTVIIIR